MASPAPTPTRRTPRCTALLAPPARPTRRTPARPRRSENAFEVLSCDEAAPEVEQPAAMVNEADIKAGLAKATTEGVPHVAAAQVGRGQGWARGKAGCQQCQRCRLCPAWCLRLPALPAEPMGVGSNLTHLAICLPPGCAHP